MLTYLCTEYRNIVFASFRLLKHFSISLFSSATCNVETLLQGSMEGMGIVPIDDAGPLSLSPLHFICPTPKRKPLPKALNPTQGCWWDSVSPWDLVMLSFLCSEGKFESSRFKFGDLHVILVGLGFEAILRLRA